MALNYGETSLKLYVECQNMGWVWDGLVDSDLHKVIPIIIFRRNHAASITSKTSLAKLPPQKN